MTEEMNPPTDNLVDELLSEDETAEFDLSTLFESQEQADGFWSQIGVQLIQLWADNDRIIYMITPPGASESLKAKMDALELPDLSPELVEVFKALKSGIQYNDHPEEKGVRIVTFKQVIQPQELLSAHNWANSPQIEFYKHIQAKGLIIQPTMQELRLLACIDVLLDIREANKSRVVSAHGMPTGVIR